MAKKSVKNYRLVAVYCGALALISVIAVVLMTPLKSTELQVLRINDSDGSVSILKPLTDGENTSYGEVLDKYWARKYISARNGYDWETIQDNYNLTILMSSQKVESRYKANIRSDSSPVKRFDDDKTIEINVKDVSFLPSSDPTKQLAQIRFTRDVIGKTGHKASEFDTTSWNATITFDYNAIINTEDERTLNPLGFRVTSYTEERVL